MTRDLGACIRLLREQQDETQTSLAKRAGVSKGVVVYLEAGALQPRLSDLQAVSKALGLELWELLRFAARLGEVTETRHLDDPNLNRANWRTA